MIRRTLLEITGPPGSGKTTLVERILHAFDGEVLVGRCVRNDSVRSFRESSPRGHPELRRYRQAGASEAALFTYKAGHIDLELVYDTELLSHYSNAIVFEADEGVELGELRAHVVPVPAPGQDLIVRKLRDRAQEEREMLDALEQLVREPDGIHEYLTLVLGSGAANVVRGMPHIVAKFEKDLLAMVQQVRSAPPPEPTEHWAIAPGYEGVELAEVVVVNIRDAGEGPRSLRLLTDVARIRKDPQVFQDVLGRRGRKTPITAVGANLEDPRHPGTKKAIARILRPLRSP